MILINNFSYLVLDPKKIIESFQIIFENRWLNAI